MLITSSTLKSLGFLTANSAPSKPKSATFLILSSKSSLKAKAENLVVIRIIPPHPNPLPPGERGVWIKIISYSFLSPLRK